MAKENGILSINGGSSSIKFAFHVKTAALGQTLYGELEDIGTKSAKLNFTNTAQKEKNVISVKGENYKQAANNLIDWLEKQKDFTNVTATGHRIVHGMKHKKPELITSDLLNELKKISSFDPEHLPEEIKLIEIFKSRFPALRQVACFDTSFHASMPVVAKLLSIPRRYYERGIQRYGFHGLSYAYLMEELECVAGKEAAMVKIILAHLGNGASLAAVKDGKCIDTSMGFTPTSGLPMGTRTGDLDPGVAWYLMKEEKLTAEQFSHLINHESGLLGISETSADMRKLLQAESTDSRAKDAIDMFCYQTKKWIGSFTAVLNGVEQLLFSGGIGEHSPSVRSKICDGLGFLGIELDEIKNMNNETIISTEKSNVCVRVIHTNEELMIAKDVCNVLNY